MNTIHKARRARRWALILISAAVRSTRALAQGSPSNTAKPANSTAKAPAKNGVNYYLSGNTWFRPAYGANGVSYTVVPTPRSRVPCHGQWC
mgnify:CR=1 FL=1